MPKPSIPSPPRVLFADDDPEVRKAFARAVRAGGYIGDLASDGIEALELASEYPYAAVVTDHQGPGLCGLELIRSLRRLQPDARYALVTGLRDVENLARHNPGLVVLGKPWKDSDLMGLIEGGGRSAAPEKRVSARAEATSELVLVVEDRDFDATTSCRRCSVSLHAMHRRSFGRSRQQ